MKARLQKGENWILLHHICLYAVMTLQTVHCRNERGVPVYGSTLSPGVRLRVRLA